MRKSSPERVVATNKIRSSVFKLGTGLKGVWHGATVSIRSMRVIQQEL
jgi:hypothetical protein